MKKIQSRKIVLPHVLLSFFLFSLVMFVAGDSHAAPNSCLGRGANRLAFPADFAEDSTFLANHPEPLERGAVDGEPNLTRFDQTQTNSVLNLIAAASHSGCSGLKLDPGVYEISRPLPSDAVRVPPGFHLRGSMLDDGAGEPVPDTVIRGVATDGDVRAIRIRVDNVGQSSRPSTISRLLLNNVQIEISGAADTRLANVVVTRVVLFDTNSEGPQVNLNRVEGFEVSRSIFLRGAIFGGKGLLTNNSTGGSILENCFGGEPGTTPSGSKAPDAGCPGYFGARMVEDLDLDDQGHFITAWNASEGLADSRFKDNWVKGSTDLTVNVGHLSTTPKVDHGIYVKFADGITIIENHFEGWPFGPARGHLKVRNASNIRILSNDIVGMHVDLRPSITPATTGWSPPGNWEYDDVLRQSCTLIDDNLFEGGDVSYKGERKDGEPGQITAQVMVTGNEFRTHSDHSTRTGLRIRRNGLQLRMHTNDSFWIVRDNYTDGNGPVSFDTTRWDSTGINGAGREVLPAGTDRWGDECSN